jgi:acetyl/propionyl-CoA carboxylase alpha subunit
MLVKAAFGGGGRGMRTVRDEGALRDEVAAAQREAAAAFGDGTVFLERLVESPRHVEVQIFGDAHGNVVHLFERECSIQRRHQKIVEEAPSPAVDARLRDELGSAAVAAAKAIGYVNAGTVEFVLAPDGHFFFLEVNTRLQVEHPVTELITGLDLVELQLRVAQGEPLPAAALDATIDGHAIEARLYAEDVAAGYLPTSGRLDRFRIAASTSSGSSTQGRRDGVRIDAGYADGSTVSTHYDAMLAKVIAWAPDRVGAAHRLSAALRHAELHGPTTNRDLLVAVLDHPEFLAAATDTGFLDRHDLARPLPVDPAVLRAHAIAASVAAREAARTASLLPRGIPPRWRNVGPAAQPVTYTAGHAEVTVDGVPDDVRVLRASPDAVELEVAGRRVRCSVQRVDASVYVDSALGSTTLVEQPRFPMPHLDAAAGSLRSPMPGTVVRVDVAVGDAVTTGQVLVALEAMKMEHAIRAPYDGVVSEVRVGAGDQTETGAVLVVVTPADES